MKFKSQAEAKAWLRKIMGPATLELEGKEKDDIMLLLAMIDPFKQTNNQRTSTDYYMIGETEYHVTYFDDEFVLERVLKEDDERTT